MGAEWRVRMGNLSNLRAQIIGELSPRVTKQWGMRYMGAMRTRFSRFSRGGGDWQPLAESTILRRRTAGSVGKNRRVNESARMTRAKKLTRLYRQQRKARTVAQVVAIRAKMSAMTSGAGVSILQDTGTLFRAMTIGNPGNLFASIHKGVRVGFAGAKVHARGKATVAAIASYHNVGGRGGHPPKRQILVPPDDATQRAMVADYKREVRKVMADNSLKGSP